MINLQTSKNAPTPELLTPYLASMDPLTRKEVSPKYYPEALKFSFQVILGGSVAGGYDRALIRCLHYSSNNKLSTQETTVLCEVMQKLWAMYTLSGATVYWRAIAQVNSQIRNL